MKANPIRKGGTATFSVHATTGKVRWTRPWSATCPDCGENVPATGAAYYSLGTHATRKSAKDALYRHRQQHHKPGLVGSPGA